MRVSLAIVVAVVVAGIGFGAYRFSASAKDQPKASTAKSAPQATDKAAPATDATPGQLWGKSCDTGADGKQTCTVTQNVIITDKEHNTSVRVLSVAVGYLPGDTNLRMALTLPLGINLPAGVGFQIDDGKPSILPVETCLADGCRIILTIDAGGRDSMVKSKLVKVTYQLANGQKMALPIELNGFGDALAQLKP